MKNIVTNILPDIKLVSEKEIKFEPVAQAAFINQQLSNQNRVNKLESKNLQLYYGDFHALKGISMAMQQNTVTAFIGPSGCGKSTFLRTLNRMNDLIEGVKIEGNVLIDGKDIYNARDINIDEVRKRVGMVFQKPNPFPK